MLGSKDPQARHLDLAVLVRLCGSVIEYARMSSIYINHCSNSWLQQLADTTEVWVELGFTSSLKYENHCFLCSPINPAFIAVRKEAGRGIAVQQ